MLEPLDPLARAVRSILLEPKDHVWTEWFAWRPVVLDEGQDHSGWTGDVPHIGSLPPIAWLTWVERKRVPLTRTEGEIIYRRMRS
jgi:hypothetical protein